jgi:hypothetical protein
MRKAWNACWRCGKVTDNWPGACNSCWDAEPHGDDADQGIPLGPRIGRLEKLARWVLARWVVGMILAVVVTAIAAGAVFFGRCDCLACLGVVLVEGKLSIVTKISQNMSAFENVAMCADFDEDCAAMSQDQREACAAFEYAGPCPYVRRQAYNAN